MECHRMDTGRSMTQKPKKGEKKGFGSSSPRFDPAANTKSTTTRNPSDLSGSGHMGSVHPGRVSMTHNAMLHQGGNQEVDMCSSMDVVRGPAGVASHDGPGQMPTSHGRDSSSASQSQRTAGKCCAELRSVYDECVNALCRENESLKLELQRCGAALDDTRRQLRTVTEAQRQLQNERAQQEGVLQRVRNYFATQPRPSTEAPLLYTFSKQAGVAKYQAVMETLVQNALGREDLTGLLAPLCPASSVSASTSVLLYVMVLSTKRLDEACTEYMDHDLIAQHAQQGRRVLLLVLRPGAHLARLSIDKRGDRPYEVLEFNITSDPVRQTRSFCADGNLSCENLPRLTSVLQPLAQQWSRDTSMWGLIMGRR